jgi:hypothetical protein
MRALAASAQRTDFELLMMLGSLTLRTWFIEIAPGRSVWRPEVVGKAGATHGNG